MEIRGERKSLLFTATGYATPPHCPDKRSTYTKQSKSRGKMIQIDPVNIWWKITGGMYNWNWKQAETALYLAGIRKRPSYANTRKKQFSDASKKKLPDRKNCHLMYNLISLSNYSSIIILWFMGNSPKMFKLVTYIHISRCSNVSYIYSEEEKMFVCGLVLTRTLKLAEIKWDV